MKLFTAADLAEILKAVVDAERSRKPTADELACALREIERLRELLADDSSLTAPSTTGTLSPHETPSTE